MERFTTFQKVLLYVAIAVFMTYILMPFFEMFMASLRPLEHLFRSLGVALFLEGIIDTLAKLVFDLLSTARMVRHKFLNIVDFPAEDDALLTSLLEVLVHFFLTFKFCHTKFASVFLYNLIAFKY